MTDRSGNTVFRIGILGHVGHQNLGDEAIIEAVIQNIRSRFENSVIRGYTMRPEDTRQRHQIAAFPLRRRRKPVVETVAGSPTGAAPPSATGWRAALKKGLRRIPVLYNALRAARTLAETLWGVVQEARFLGTAYRTLDGTDLLIIAGSHQINDFAEGIWGFPYTIFKWCLMARLCGAKVAFMSVGAGPVDTKLARFFYRHALSWAIYRSFRDDHACRLIGELGIAGENPFVPDLAFSLNVAEPAPPVQLAGRPVVGINPLPLFDSTYWHASDNSLYQAYVLTLARFACWLIETGHAVSLFPTQLRVDPGVIAEVRKAMREIAGAGVDQFVLEPQVRSFADLARAITASDIVVPTRYHGILISLLLRKPVLALAYHGKSKDLMTMLGQQRFALTAAECDLKTLQERFLLLETDKPAAITELESRLPAIRQAVWSQYDRVFNQFTAARGIEASLARTDRTASCSPR